MEQVQMQVRPEMLAQQVTPEQQEQVVAAVAAAAELARMISTE
jgi:hypothetical protein